MRLCDSLQSLLLTPSRKSSTGKNKSAVEELKDLICEFTVFTLFSSTVTIATTNIFLPNQFCSFVCDV